MKEYLKKYSNANPEKFNKEFILSSLLGRIDL